MNRGLACLQIEKYNQAHDDFSKVISFQPDMALAYYNRANAAIGMEDKPSACEDMRQAAKLGYEKAFKHISYACQN